MPTPVLVCLPPAPVPTPHTPSHVHPHTTPTPHPHPRTLQAADSASALLGTSLGQASDSGLLSGPGGLSTSLTSASLLGTSPSGGGTLSRLNAPGSAGEHYMYQAADGQWVFLHPLNLRCATVRWNAREQPRQA